MADTSVMSSKAVIYCRVSTVEQVDGTSLATQEAACREYCARNGWEILRVFTDAGESAKSADRPAFLSMVTWCGVHKPDFCLVYRADRFARNTYDHAVFSGVLAKHGTTLQSVTEPFSDDPAGRLMQTVLAGIAQFDNEIRAARARESMVDLANRGYWVHKAPSGYRNGRDANNNPILVPGPQAPLLVKAFKDLASTYTVTEVARFLADGGFVHSNGLHQRKDHTTSLHRIFRDPIYAGVIRSSLTQWRSVPAAFPGLVDRETFDRVQLALLEVGKPCRKYTKLRNEFPYRGLIKCTCGKTMTASYSRSKSGRYFGYYRCRACKVSVTLPAMHAAMDDLIAEVSDLADPVFPLLRANIIGRLEGLDKAAEKLRLETEQRRIRLQAQYDILVEGWINGLISEDTFKKRSAKAQTDLAACKSSHNDRDMNASTMDGLLGMAHEALRNLHTLMDKLDLPRRHELLRLLFSPTLIWRSGKLYTPVTPCILSVLREFSPEKARMAPPQGVEAHTIERFVADLRELVAIVRREAA